jgi:hypothetical protein
VVSRYSDSIKPFSAAEFPVVPVENVMHVIEIKSRLESKHCQTFKTNLDVLGGFERYYAPTDIYRIVHQGSGEDPKTQLRGRPILASQGYMGIRPISGGMFAFEGPKETATLLSWLNELKADLSLFYVCVLDRYFVLRDESGGWRVIQPYADQDPAVTAYAFFITTILEIMKGAGEHEMWAVCDSQRYFDFAARALDELYLPTSTIVQQPRTETQ